MGLENSSYALIAFDSTHHAIRAEKFLLDAAIKVNIIPVPTEISAGCGLSIKIEPDDLSAAIEVLELNSILASGFYLVKLTGFKKEIVKQI